MGILIAALAALLLTGPGLLPAPPDALPDAFWKYRDVALIFLLLYIAVQSLLSRRPRGSAAPAPQPAAPSAPPAEAPKPPRAEPPAEAPKPPRAEPPAPVGDALVLLSLLQEKGRFLDYLMEDITAYSDAQVAAASRVVHQGCAGVIRECLALSPTHAGKEGERVSLDASADLQRYRLTGKVQGGPPYSGVLVHRGWRTTKLALPRLMRPVDPSGENVIAPAEVEVR